MSEQDPGYLEAKKRVQNIKSFYMNLFSYIVINVFLLILNLLTSPHSLWFYWPLLGWGIGLVFHGFSAFGGHKFGKQWEERQIQKILDNERD